MQELEKILEEIENLQDIQGWDLQTVQGILEIVRKHMSGKGINVPTEEVKTAFYKEKVISEGGDD